MARELTGLSILELKKKKKKLIIMVYNSKYHMKCQFFFKDDVELYFLHASHSMVRFVFLLWKTDFLFFFSKKL